MAKEPIWREWLNKIAGWFKDLAPWTLLLAVWRWFRRKLWFAERTIEEKELEVKHYENKEEVQKHNNGLDDRELVDEMLREGNEFRKSQTGDGES